METVCYLEERNSNSDFHVILKNGKIQLKNHSVDIDSKNSDANQFSSDKKILLAIRKNQDEENPYVNLFYVQNSSLLTSCCAEIIDYEIDDEGKLTFIIVSDYNWTTMEKACKKFSQCPDWLNFLSRKRKVNVRPFADPDVEVHFI
jgi:hypothetical protein